MLFNETTKKAYITIRLQYIKKRTFKLKLIFWNNQFFVLIEWVDIKHVIV